MSEKNSEVPRSQKLDSLEIPDEEYERIVIKLKEEAVDFALKNGAENWLSNALESQRFLDGVVSDMRHLVNGQIYILEKLQELKPDLYWYRGGTIATWKELRGHERGATVDELETLTIDGGANGVLGRPEMAINYAAVSPRKEPVIYTISIDSLIEGLKLDAILLVSEHGYDLRVLPGKNTQEYLRFCRTHLNINDATTSDAI